MEFSIIKLFDGIFIGNRSVLTDYQFISNNKISHLIAWLNSPIFNSSQQNGIISQKQAIEIMKMMGIVPVVFTHSQQIPDINIMQSANQAIIKSRQQQLCCLIVADTIFDALSFIVFYLQNRFDWSIRTVFGFIEIKLDNLGFSNLQSILSIVQNKYSKAYFNEGTNFSEIQNNCNSRLQQEQEDSFIQFMNINKIETAIDMDITTEKGKTIQWKNRTFMEKYTTDDMEEKLLINTIKNMNINSGNVDFSQQKKGKRIKWLDQQKNLGGSAQKIFANSLINSSLKKSNLINNLSTNRPKSGKLSLNNFTRNGKSSNQLNTKNLLKNDDSQKPLDGLRQENVNKNIIKQLRNSKKHDKQSSLFQDSVYKQLKQLSRTNFSDLTNINRRLSSKKKKLERASQSKYTKNKFFHSKNKQNIFSQSMQCLGLPATFNQSKNVSSNKINSRKKLTLFNINQNSKLKKQQNNNGVQKKLQCRASSQIKAKNSSLIHKQEGLSIQNL